MPYIPFPAAEEIHKSRARFIVIAAGNRFAKSLIAAMECTAAMTVPGCHIWIAAPTLAVADNEWEYLEHCLTKTDLWYEKIAPEIIRQAESKGKKCKNAERYLKVKHTYPKSITIDWPAASKSIIEQRSYGRPQDYVKLEGVKLTGLIFAEGSKVPSEVWERHLKKRLSDKSGWVIFPSTPKGKDELLYPAFENGLSDELVVSIDFNREIVTAEHVKREKGEYHIDNAKSYMESYETFQYPGYANPYYNKRSYESDVKLLFDGKLNESTFKERNFGTFESFAGSFYAGVDWEVCIKNSKDINLDENGTHYVTIDPGRASRASAHWINVSEPDEFGVEQWVIYDELYQSGLWATALAKIIKEKTQHPIQGYVADRVVTRDTNHSERSVEKQLKEEGLSPMVVPHTMPRYTIDRLNYWKPRLMRGQIIILGDKCPELVRELQELEFERPSYTGGKTLHKEILAKGDMHGIDDITYAVYCKIRWVPPHEATEEKVERKISKRSFAYEVKRYARKDSLLSGIGSH